MASGVLLAMSHGASAITKRRYGWCWDIWQVNFGSVWYNYCNNNLYIYVCMYGTIVLYVIFIDVYIYTFTYIHLLVNLAGGYVLSIFDVFWWIPPLGTCWLSNWTCLSGQRDAYEKLDLCAQIRKGTAGHRITQRNRRAIFFSWFFDQSPACNQRKHQLWPPVWRFWSGPWLHMMQFALVTFQTRWVSLIHRISSLCRMLDIALGICNDAPDKQLGFLDSTAVVWHMPTIHGWCIAMLCFRCNQKPFSLSVPAPISFGAWYASLAAGVCVCVFQRIR